MVSLGFRSLKTAETSVPKPPPTKAWIAVSLKRNVAVGPVHVLLTPMGGQSMVVGSINGTSPQHGLIASFLRDKGRFPSWGGFAVDPGQSYTVALTGRNSADVEHTSAPSAAFVPAAGAIVDLALELWAMVDTGAFRNIRAWSGKSPAPWWFEPSLGAARCRGSGPRR